MFVYTQSIFKHEECPVSCGLEPFNLVNFPQGAFYPITCKFALDFHISLFFVRVSDPVFVMQCALYAGETASENRPFFLNFKLMILFYSVTRRLSYWLCVL